MPGRQAYQGCYIAGPVDFIFGGATAFFEDCHIHCLRDGYITAASTPDTQPLGFVVSACNITGERPELLSQGPPQQVIQKLEGLFAGAPVTSRPSRKVPRKKTSAWRSYWFQRHVRKSVF
jgi:hypothetical protein